MATISELNNAALNDPYNNDGSIPTQISNNMIFDSAIPTFDPDNNNDGVADLQNPFVQYGLVFNQNSYLSNGLSSLSRSINDFSVFNPYIHYAAGSIINQVLNNLGVDTTINRALTYNVYGALNLAQTRFEIYNRNYRKTI